MSLLSQSTSTSCRTRWGVAAYWQSLSMRISSLWWPRHDIGCTNNDRCGSCPCSQSVTNSVSTTFRTYQLTTCARSSYSAASRLAPSQWETSLQSNVVSHWPRANLELALSYQGKGQAIITHSICADVIDCTCPWSSTLKLRIRSWVYTSHGFLL